MFKLSQATGLPNPNIEINVFPSNTCLKVRSKAEDLKDVRGYYCFSSHDYSHFTVYRRDRTIERNSVETREKQWEKQF